MGTPGYIGNAGLGQQIPQRSAPALWEMTQDNAKKVADLANRLENLRAHFIGRSEPPNIATEKNPSMPSHTELVAMTGDGLNHCSDVLSEIFQIIGA